MWNRLIGISSRGCKYIDPRVQSVIDSCAINRNIRYSEFAQGKFPSIERCDFRKIWEPSRSIIYCIMIIALITRVLINTNLVLVASLNFWKQQSVAIDLQAKFEFFGNHPKIDQIAFQSRKFIEDWRNSFRGCSWNHIIFILYLYLYY